MADQPATTASLTPKKSYRAGSVGVAVRIKCGGWHGDSAKIEATTELTTAQARAIAQSLIDLADKADAKVAAKAASEARRKAWRDREVAAGRRTSMSLEDVFRAR